MVRAIRRRRVIRRNRAARRAGRAGMRKKALGRSSVKRSSDYAKCVEIQETQLVATKDEAGESVGSLMNFCLADFQRPQEIAHAYKYYRASKVELSFIPYFNVAQTGGLGNTQIPQLYMSVDRLSNRWIAPTETECLERGITPKLFNKKRVLRWKPNLVQGVSLEVSQPSDGGGRPLGIEAVGYQNGIALFDKWLPTQQTMGYGTNANPGPFQTGQQLTPMGVNPYALRYHGALYNAAVEGQAANTNFICGDIQLKITWEFKGPRALKMNTPQPEPNPVSVTSSQGPAFATPNTQQTTYP